jgi:hypothetical protein
LESYYAQDGCFKAQTNGVPREVPRTVYHVYMDISLAPKEDDVLEENSKITKIIVQDYWLKFVQN